MKTFLFSLACSVCFGDPGSLATKGVKGAILFLLIVVFCVLGAITAAALIWTRRARQIGREV